MLALARNGALLAVFCVVTNGIGLLGIAAWLALLPLTLGHRLVARRPSAAARQADPPPLVTLALHAAADVVGRGAAPRDTLLLVHGWPDWPGLWAGTVRALNAAGYDCLVATLPGSADAPLAAAPSPQQLVRALHDALPPGCGRVTLLLHDWGCVYGMLLAEAHPQRVKRLVALDVGGHVPDSTLLLCLVTYHWPLACAFAFGGPVGDWMVRAMAGAFSYRARPLAALHSSSGFHYRSFWRAGLHVPSALRDAWPLRGLARRSVSFGAYEPAVPTLFVYGTVGKPLPFHSARWEARVRETPRGEVVAMQSSHWLMVDRPDELNALLVRWLAETDEAPRR